MNVMTKQQAIFKELTRLHEQCEQRVLQLDCEIDSHRGKVDHDHPLRLEYEAARAVRAKVLGMLSDAKADADENNKLRRGRAKLYNLEKNDV